MIFTLLSLFLGLVTPFSYFTLSVATAVFGLLVYAQLKNLPLKSKIAVWLLSGLGIFLVYIIQADFLKALVGLTIFSISYWLYYWLHFNRKQLALIVLFTLAIGLFGVALIDGAQLRKQLGTKMPPPFPTDMYTYLNTIYLYKESGNYYSSFSASIQGSDINFGTDQLAGEVWGWKQPLIFILWKILPGAPPVIQWLGAAVFVIILVAAYKIARVFLPSEKALIAPFLVWPYLHYPLVEMTLLQVEWWALMFFILGLMIYMLRRYWLTGIAFALCLAVRELFAIPIVGLVAIQFFSKHLKKALILLLPTLLFFFPYYYFYHLHNVFQYETFNILSGQMLRLGALGGWEFIRTTLTYGSWNYAVWIIRPFWLLLATNSFGLGVLVFSKKKKANYLSLLISFLLFFLLSFKIGIMDLWHDYWGIYYIPILLLSTPIVFDFYDKKSSRMLKWFRKRILI